MSNPKPTHGLAAISLLCLLALSLGCRAIETPEEIQSLAGDVPREPAADTAASPSPAPQAGSEDLDSFPLVGSVFPGLGGRLHSSLCDPASDPFSTCI